MIVRALNGKGEVTEHVFRVRIVTEREIHIEAPKGMLSYYAQIKYIPEQSISKSLEVTIVADDEALNVS